jgi:hypothetical protein
MTRDWSGLAWLIVSVALGILSVALMIAATALLFLVLNAAHLLPS